MNGIEWSTGLEGKTPIETALNIRWLLVVLEFPGIYDSKNMLLLYRVLDKVLGIFDQTAELMMKWINEYSKVRFLRLVCNLKGIFPLFLCCKLLF